MAKKKKEEVIEEVTEQVEETTEQTEDAPQIDKSKFDSADDDSVTKIDLNQPPKTETDAVQEQETTTVDDDTSTTDSEEVVEEVPQQEESVQDETAPVVEEITGETTEQEVTNAIVESEETGKPLPDNVQKLVNFMEETGGDLEDYVALKRDYSDYDDSSLLMEYYMRTKPHLTEDEVIFTLEDQFSWDNEVDDEVDIKRKQLALKEQVADARGFLDELKSNYYEEIKGGSKLTGEQQKAVNFFNRYNEESKVEKAAMEQNQKIFIERTDGFFNDKFKGFEYNVGDKKFRFNVKDVNKVKGEQADLGNFVEKFLGNKFQLEDAAGYHKGLFTAMNADTIASHFYEQGKADAMKSSVAKAKNIDMTPRQSHGEIETGGLKFKVLGDTSEDFKFKIKQK